MARYLMRRLLTAALTLLCITVVIFSLLSLVQGQAPDMLRASEGGVSEAEYQALVHSLGLDKPLPVRYVLWLRNVLRGDLGTSTRFAAPVGEIIRQRIGPSLLLTTTGLAIAVLIAIPLGVLAALRPGSVWDRVSSFFALAGSTFPRFIVCLTGIYLLSYKLRLFPALGMHSPGNDSLRDLLWHLALPAAIIGFSTTGYMIKQTRSSCLEVFHEDYLKTARAKGLPEHAVILRHGLRTALAPIITQIMLEVPDLVGGSAIAEKIFGWPGIGSLMIEAIASRDHPLILGVAMVISVAVLLANILLDILYVLLDPRVTYS